MTQAKCLEQGLATSALAAGEPHAEAVTLVPQATVARGTAVSRSSSMWDMLPSRGTYRQRREVLCCRQDGHWVAPVSRKRRGICREGDAGRSRGRRLGSSPSLRNRPDDNHASAWSFPGFQASLSLRLDDKTRSLPGQERALEPGKGHVPIRRTDLFSKSDDCPRVICLQAVCSLLGPEACTPGEDTARGATCKPGHGFSPGTESAGTVSLDPPASRTVRNKFLLLKPPDQWCFVTAAELTDTGMMRVLLPWGRWAGGWQKDAHEKVEGGRAPSRGPGHTGRPRGWSSS
ncbi:PREDICTED: uncharacterized protein LOC106723826 [Myotis brandtii]|uniref:uncharacterized protein LOC106723826 n=1 Tax=Myotis brandtii TaxID=109478 RepID=UPI000703EFFC|nr:PREDICTED: uncharacterized protein LOC106723826 [Myotis brandtii]